jgi:hypothetical protein
MSPNSQPPVVFERKECPINMKGSSARAVMRDAYHRFLPLDLSHVSGKKGPGIPDDCSPRLAERLYKGREQHGVHTSRMDEGVLG